MVKFMMWRLRYLLILVALITASAAYPQATEPLKWDVVSVKPESPSSCSPGGGGITYLADGLSARCVSAVFIIEFAYHLMDPNRILGLPKWAYGPELFSVEARVSPEDAGAFVKLRRDEKSGMMQNVLTQRFALAARTEEREMPAFALEIAKGGSKLKAPVDTTKGYSQFGGGDGEVRWANSPLTDLKFLLAKETGKPVVDHTGLTGKYDFTLNYLPSAQQGIGTSDRPPIFVALKEQLGLELVSTKAPVQVLVVGSLQQPSAN